MEINDFIHRKNISDFTKIDPRGVNQYDGNRRQFPQEYTQRIPFFSKQNIEFISDEITRRLEGVHPERKNIIVPDETIISVMDSIYENTNRNAEEAEMMVISTITEQIRNEYETIANNNKLDIWKAYQYRQELGIQQHEKIKLNLKRPTRMAMDLVPDKY